jgi:TolA-binding protein
VNQPNPIYKKVFILIRFVFLLLASAPLFGAVCFANNNPEINNLKKSMTKSLTSKDADKILLAWKTIEEQNLFGIRTLTGYAATNVSFLIKKALNENDASLLNRAFELHSLFQNKVRGYSQRESIHVNLIRASLQLSDFSLCARIADSFQNKMKDRFIRNEISETEVFCKIGQLGFDPATGLSKISTAKITSAEYDFVQKKIKAINNNLPIKRKAHLNFVSIQFDLNQKNTILATRTFESVARYANDSELGKNTAQSLYNLIFSLPQSDIHEHFLEILLVHNITVSTKSRMSVTQELEEVICNNAARLFKQGDYQNSSERFKKCRGSTGKSERAEKALYFVALSYFYAKDFTHSIYFFNKYRVLYPDSTNIAEVHFKIGESLFQKKEYNLAYDAFNRAALSTTQHTLKKDGLLIAGESLVAANRISEAIALFFKVVADTNDKETKIKILKRITSISNQSNFAGQKVQALDALVELTTEKDLQLEILKEAIGYAAQIERADLVYKYSKKTLSVLSDPNETSATKATALHSLALIDLEQMIINIRRLPDFRISELKDFMRTFTELREHLIAPCSFAITELCVVGLFEAVMKAQQVAHALVNLRLPKYSTSELNVEFAEVIQRWLTTLTEESISTLEKLESKLQLEPNHPLTKRADMPLFLEEKRRYFLELNNNTNQ